MSTRVVAASDRARLRRDIRAARRSLSVAERELRSHALCQRIARSGLLLRANQFACFHPHDGEVDLSPLFARLWRMGKTVYLPVIPGPRLWFLPFTPETRLKDNRFGIAEPDPRAAPRSPLHALDVVLMPLVAFDGLGNRIGMGGGYYDRTFAFLRTRRAFRRPRLIGTAFDLQRVDQIDAQAWDVPLDGAVTDAGFYWFR